MNQAVGFLKIQLDPLNRGRTRRDDILRAVQAVIPRVKGHSHPVAAEAGGGAIPAKREGNGYMVNLELSAMHLS
ncbi:unnamed protein product [Peniophora sp. CBMAI 1063]|nr:unnamed protein product [Peniophora sp. CBMAI 1063]